MVSLSQPAPVASTVATRGWSGKLLAALPGVAGFSLLTALFAQVAVPLPGTPVPMTLQTMAVLLSGIALGTRRGAASQVLYVAGGAMGLPVFAGARAGLTLATGGYLLGFVLAALVVGHLYRRVGSSPAGLTAVCAAGVGVILISGVVWLAAFFGGDVGLAAAQGLWPFLPVEGLKVATTVALVWLVRGSHRRLDPGTSRH